MLKYIALTAAGLLVLAGCAPQPAETVVGLGQEFTLAIGQAASIAGEQLKIRFVDVISDSR
ncbi:MAG: hypothetical protein A2147_03110 [Chloroflexi bacterium RBG_16_57_8]|nr:MAG: hypothetical protein A2147_03110 [Chloroflexi bacterium RBG_16_57_8]